MPFAPVPWRFALFLFCGCPRLRQDAAISAFAVAIGFTVITALHIVVGELIPKSLAIFSTERYAPFTAGPLVWFYRITYPVMWLFNSITNGVMRLLGHDPANEHEVYTEEEIQLLIGESSESGLIGFVPEEASECETAAGLLLTLFDRIPAEGDVVSVKGRDAEATFIVVDMDRHRVDRIQIEVASLS